MKPNIIHSIVVCLLAFALPLLVGCSSHEEEPLPVTTESALYLNVAMLGQTRSGQDALSGNERMQSLRVIVLHENGTVEHNRYYSLLNGPWEEQYKKYILLKVAPNEKKKIYLFANEEGVAAVEGVTGKDGRSLTQFFDSYATDASGFAEAVNGLYFAPDYSEGNPIPMSSVYEIDFKEGKVEETFYVVRVATKFTVNFKNWRGEEVTVKSLSIASHADKNFLMAHVNDSEQNRQLFGEGKNWIDWLREVSDASSVNDSYATTEAAGWLKDYDLPTQANATNIYTYDRPVTVGLPTVDSDHPENVEPGVASEVPVFYLPESKSLKEGATDGEQAYTLTLNVAGEDGDKSFVCSLPNLKALFRNTSVVVNISMYGLTEFVVDVIPFTSVDLTPDFGLEREDFTGYIIGKDEEGRPCWYDGGAGPYYIGPNGHIGDFVTINGKEYLLVYADYERTVANLDHIFGKNPRKKYLLYPAAITGYENVNWVYYLNDLRQRVWLDQVTRYNWYHTLNEWERQEWNLAIYDGKEYYPRFWFDLLGNRYPWSEGDTPEKRGAILGEWTQYLE